MTAADPPGGTAVAADLAATAPSGSDRDGRGVRQRPHPATVAFAAWLATVAGLALVTGRYGWFDRDDWKFITAVAESGPLVLEPHNGHWSTFTALLYRGLEPFGLDHYLPYVILVVVIWLLIAVALRQVLRRSGVGPWLATALAGATIALSPVLNATLPQTLLSATLGIGLAQLLLLDHPGGWDRREWAATALGLLALMTSGAGVPVAAGVGLYALLRRGIAVAAGVTLPALVAFSAWWALFGERVKYPPPAEIGPVLAWLRATAAAPLTLLAVGAVLAWVLAGLLAAGYAAAWWRAWREVRTTPLLLSVSLLATAVALSAASYGLRWFLGPAVPSDPRMAAATLVCCMPALGVALQELVRRHRLFVVVLLIPAAAVLVRPADLWSASQEQLITRTARQADLAAILGVAEQDAIPDWVRANFGSRGTGMGATTVGLLRGAVAAGRLDASGWPTTAQAVEQARARMGLARVEAPIEGMACREYSRALDLAPVAGARFGYPRPPFLPQSPITIAVIQGDRAGAAETIREETVFQSVVPGRRYRIEAATPAAPFLFCQER